MAKAQNFANRERGIDTQGRFVAVLQRSEVGNLFSGPKPKMLSDDAVVFEFSVDDAHCIADSLAEQPRSTFYDRPSIGAV